MDRSALARGGCRGLAAGERRRTPSRIASPSRGSRSIGLTFVVIKTWDKRRLILPITQLVETSFENWTRTDRRLIATIVFHADYRVPVTLLRDEFRRLVEADPDWDGDALDFAVTDTTDRTVVLRGIASADAARVFDMHCRIREQMVEFLQRLDGGVYLPRTRIDPGVEAARELGLPPVSRPSPTARSTS